ncbi:MOSC domain-containing protein [Cytobacillus spongiae]|uniref:MOSC domain-containing protein n=1 Tax=Cytobacillus spongiae TaxID=2901381 RepID=UPI003D79AB28
MLKGSIVALSVGKPKTFHWKGKEELSGIGKHRVQSVRLDKERFEGDDVANPEFHGGAERAVCLYPFEHYALWEREFNQPLTIPAFGENICMTGMLEKDVYIGDILSVGSAILQVTQGRVPCSTISKFNEIDPLLARIVETGYTGYFCKVLQEGILSDTDEITLIERIQDQVSILYANEIMFHDRKNQAGIESILNVEELAVDWRDKLTKRLNQLTN